ncbi:nucleotidyltransferase domain-containing protein [Nitrosomonas sp. Nm58]|uniref:nucleotidyltransferase domain-containing protein n=1 Tax=Nitrosomonas sp. Nm58 TaxID=200126 RepID=UPI00089A3FD4|nr:nucleotidyltransferase domain-containing protein [Nitrosomonas sp. Nm58]SDY63996.1 hypothetical protein SAMN05421754_101616 [Nitrosomonas sp. Nm58]
MRLTQNQVMTIRQAVAGIFGAGAQAWLFGSRVNNSKRGGDIDLLIHPDSKRVNNLLLRKTPLLGQL